MFYSSSCTFAYVRRVCVCVSVFHFYHGAPNALVHYLIFISFNLNALRLNGLCVSAGAIVIGRKREIAVDFSYGFWTNKAKCNTSASKLSHKEMGKRSHDGRDLCAWIVRLCSRVCILCWVNVSVDIFLVWKFTRSWCNIHVEYVDDVPIFGGIRRKGSGNL